MSLASILKRDVKNREALVAQSEALLSVWRRELARAPKPAQVDHSKPVPRNGVDYAYGRPAPKMLREAGVTFVCRYLSSESKGLGKGEAADLSAANIDIVTVYEQFSLRALHAYDAGVQDAVQARKLLADVDAPKGAVAFFAVDFDAVPVQLDRIVEYVRGATDHLGWDRVGIYGGLLAVNHVLALNACKYGWQTYAWSGTPARWCSRAQLRQTENGVHVAGIEVDLDTAVAADFGAWRV
jgi:hypothetical protein